jgi:pyruvate/2-oxoglutarate dehydrogenase complex dihydrolipoamide acyltransferase (E2) component
MCEKCVRRSVGRMVDDLRGIGLQVDVSELLVEFDGENVTMRPAADEQPAAADEPAPEPAADEPAPAGPEERKATMRAELRAILAAQHTDLPEPSEEGLAAARELSERLGISYAEAVRAIHAAEVGVKLRTLILRSVAADVGDAIGVGLRNAVEEFARRMKARSAL